MLDVQSHELVEGVNESEDVAKPLDETPQETLVEEISHDLVCIENMTMSTCMEIFASSKDPLSYLYVAFPYLVFDDSASFICVDCEGISICQICDEIEACQRRDPLVPRDCEAACADSMIDDLVAKC